VPELVPALLGRRPEPKGITEEALALLAMQAWRGNVRQLAGAVEWLAVRSDGDVIDGDDVRAMLEERMRRSGGTMPMGPVKATGGRPGGRVGRFDAETSAHERSLLEQALREADGNVSAAAKALGIDRMRMMRLLRKLGSR
jgi:DNA-binding NtrC family response regulator